MDLSKVRLVGEHDKHFELHDGDSGFVVAKKGLSKALQDKIRKMAPVAAKANGGEQPLESLPEDAAQSVPLAPLVSGEPGQPFVSPVGPYVGGLATVGSPVSPVGPYVGQYAGPDAAAVYQADLEAKGLIPTAAELAPAPPAALPVAPARSAPPEESMLDMLKRMGMEKLLEQAAGVSAAPAVPKVAPVAPVQIPPVEEPKSETAEQVKKLKQEEAKATTEKELAEAEGQAKLATLLGETVAANKAEEEQAKAEYQRAVANQQRLSKMAEEFQINPDNYFGNLSTGSKIATILSMAVGGFAQGYSGGRIPNYAAEALDKAIERDIDAQRQRKDSLYKQLLAATGDAEKAGALARAKTQEIAALKVSQLGAQSKSEVFRKAAAVTAAQLNASALTAYQAVLNTDMNMNIARRNAQLNEMATAEQIATQRQGRAATALGMAATQEQMEQRRAIARAQLQEITATRAQRELTDAMSSGAVKLTGAQINALPEPVRKRAVQLEPNQWTLALSDDDAKEVKKFLPVSKDVKEYVSEMLKYAKQNVIGEVFPSGIQRRMESLSSEALIAVNKASGLGALDKGSQEVLQNLIAPPTGLFSYGPNSAARLQQVLDIFESAETNFLNSRLSMPQRPSRMSIGSVTQETPRMITELPPTPGL